MHKEGTHSVFGNPCAGIPVDPEGVRLASVIEIEQQSVICLFARYNSH